MIEVQNLTKKFPRHLAVDDISFSVGKGEIVGFLGPNGAGKTTTLRMLTGFLPPTQGLASIAGYDVFKESLEARKRIGYMPENVPLYFDMRVREYLKFRGKLKGLKGSRLRDRMAQVMEECGLTHMRKKIIGNLSKGYKQRVGLADALIHEPDLLILDEPTNGLDPNQIRSIRQLIKKLGKEHTIRLSTHILSEVEMTCDKVIIVDNGRIKASDTPANLVKNMRSAGQIQVETRSHPDEALAALEQLKHVKKVTHQKISEGSDRKESWHRYDLIVNSGTDPRERIYDLAHQKQWQIRSLYRNQATLEDVFVELTRRD